MEDSADERSVRRVVWRAVDTALIPVHAATSKPAQRAYLGTLLFTTTSIFLLCISSIAYALFYYNYIPQIGIERVIHLQFGNGSPYGTADLSGTLTSFQPYDISLYLHLPRTTSNLAAGNFMLDVSLLAPLRAPQLMTATSTGAPNTTTLAHSRRPAIMTYVSPLVDTASTLSGIPFYVLGWKHESEVLEISVFEGVEFVRGWTNIPRFVKVAIEADEKMQFYEVGVKIVARFGGLRWLVYHHRILSYLFFTTTFWMGSMVSCLIAWVVISMYLPGWRQTEGEQGDKEGREIKREDESDEEFDPNSLEDMSDTSRTFPTLGRQLPLQFKGRKGSIKQEDEDAEKLKKEGDRLMETTNIQPLGAEADDEDDDVVASWRDSGIGTSMEDTDRRRSVQKRRKALFGGDK